MLRLDAVSASIAGAQVLRRVSLFVPPGGRVALIGRNGAGKTTTLRVLMGLLPIEAGLVQVDSRDCAAIPAHQRARHGVGYAPEERRLFGSFTVQQNIILPGEVVGLARPEVMRRLEAIYTLLPELRDLSPRRAAGLSGGQGKMVALGRALDEPFQGLAPALALRYSEALARLRAALPDVAILITESSPDLLRPLVDSTYVIERGEIFAA
jgi:branched-chain amino acid transport system ATP-binding protein